MVAWCTSRSMRAAATLTSSASWTSWRARRLDLLQAERRPRGIAVTAGPLANGPALRRAQTSTRRADRAPAPGVGRRRRPHWSVARTCSAGCRFEDRADELTHLVHRARRDAGRGDRSQEVFHLTPRHLSGRAIAQRGQDLASRGARATAVGLAGLGEKQTVIAHRRRLRGLHVFEPLQILDRQLAESDAAPAALVGIALEQLLLGVVLAYKHQHPLRGHRLGHHPVRPAATPATLSAVPVRFHPSTPKRTDNRLVAPRLLAVPERAGGALSDEGSCAWIGRHQPATCRLLPTERLPGQRSGQLPFRAVLASESRLSSANRMPVNAGYGVPVGAFCGSSGSLDLDYSGRGRELLFGRAALPDPRAQNDRGGDRVVGTTTSAGRASRAGGARSAATPCGARDQAQGETPGEHHTLIHKLEAEWKHELERLHRTRQAAQD